MALQEKTKQIIDGWVNALTKIGKKNQSRNPSTTYARNDRVYENLADDLFRFDGIIKRGVTTISSDMLREGFEVTVGQDAGENNEIDSMVKMELDRLKANHCIETALIQDMLYGGSLTTMIINDGSADLLSPLNLNSIQTLDEIRTNGRWRVSIPQFVQDPSAMRFGQAEQYQVTPINVAGNNAYNIHHSRTLRLNGTYTPEQAYSENDTWGDPLIQSWYQRFRAFGVSLEYIEEMIHDFIQVVIRVPNLQAMLRSDDSLITGRAEIIDLTRAITNAMWLDKEEGYEKLSTNVAGIYELMEIFMMTCSTVTGLPMTLLFGQSPKGMNATGDSDIRLWYDKVAASQVSILKPYLKDLIEIIFLQKQGPFKGSIPENWSIVFNPLWQPTPKEQAETRKTVADTDVLYYEMGVLSADEIRESRFGGSEYSAETQIEGEIRPTAPTDAEE